MTDFSKTFQQIQNDQSIVPDEQDRDVLQAPSLEPQPVKLDLSRTFADPNITTLERGTDPKLNISVQDGVRQNPDQYAKAVKLSEKTGIPTDSVLSDVNAAEADSRFADIDLDLLRQNNPTTSAFMSVRDNAAQSHDDVDTLTSIENWFSKTFENFGETTMLGFEKRGLGLILAGTDATPNRVDQIVSPMSLPIGMQDLAFDISRDIAENVGVETDDQLVQVKKEATDFLIGDLQRVEARVSEMTPDELTLMQEGVRGGASMVIDNLITLAALPAGPGAATFFGLSNAAAQTFTDSYGTARVGGKSPAESARFAGIDATIEVLTERLPTKALEGMFRPVMEGDITKEAIKFFISEIPGEQAATFLQSMNALAHDLDDELKNATPLEAVEIQLRRQAVTLISTLVGGGTQTAVVTTAGKVAEKLSTKAEDTEASSNTEQKRIDDLIELSQNSKLRERNSEALKQFTQDAETENDLVRIDAKQLDEYLKQSEIDPTQDPAFEAVADQIDEAAALGGDVLVPVSDFVANVAASEHAEALRPHMRLSSDTLTPFEAETQQEERQAYVESIIAEAEQEVDLLAESQQIFETVRDQLIETGRVDRKAAKFMAQLMPAWAAVKSKQTGMSVAEVYQTAGLTIEGPFTEQIADQAEREAALVLEQTDPNLEVPFDSPVTLEDGTRISGFSDASRNKFYGFTPAGEAFVIGRDAVNLDQDIVSETGGDLAVEKFRREAATQPTGEDVQADTLEQQALPDDVVPTDEQVTVEQLNNRDQNIEQLQADPTKLTEDFENDYDRVIAEAPIIDPQDLVGKTIVPTLADLTDAGRQFTGIDSSQISEPIELQGGPKFPLLESYQNGEVVWAVNDTGGLTKLQKGDMVVVSAMSADTHRSNATVVQALLSNLDAYVRDGRISDENMQRLDDMIRHGNKGIEAFKAIGYPEGSDAATVKKWLQNKKTRAQHKKVPVTVRNAMGKQFFSRYKDGERLTPAEWTSMTESVMDFMSDRTFADFPGVENADAYHQWAEDLTFVNRAEFTDILTSKEAQELGTPNFTRILRETIDKDYAGYNFGDALLVIEVDKGADARIELGTDGTKKHRSYKYGVKGKVVGRFARPVSFRTLYPEFMEKRRGAGADPKGDRRSFQLSLPEQEITPEIAGQIASEPYQAIGSPRQATLALDFKRGNWADSNTSKKDGGISVTDFTDALRASDAAASLTLYDPKDVGKDIRKGDTSVYQLGDSEVYFGLKRGYDYADEYGVDLEAAGLTTDEVAVVGVVNNEPGAKGVAGPAVMLKAIEEGATVLDAFAVRSDRFPDGFLPSLYSEFGFETVATVPFDPQYFTEQHIGDLKRLWTEGGWKEADGFPDVAVMKWSGTDEQRENATTKWIESVTAGGESTTGAEPDAAATETAGAWIGEADTDTRSGERDTGDGTGSVRTGDRAPLSGRLGRVLSELEGLSDTELTNLGITAEQRDGQVLEQRQDGQPQARGYFDSRNNIIRLTEASDLSTFLHESAHFFLEMEWKFNSPEVQNINDWWKRNDQAVATEASRSVEGLTTDITTQDVHDFIDFKTTGDSKKDSGIRRAIHEQFARGFETYLREGKAPTLELRQAFRAFARWLNNIYRKVRGDLNVKLDNEIRQVFDRMLATEEQIAQSEAVSRYQPLFNDAAIAGMTDEEFAAYQEKSEKATDKATETLRDKLIAEITRQTKSWWNDEVKERAAVAVDQLKDKPVYKAMEALRAKDADFKLDRAQVKELLGIDKIPPSLRNMTVTGAEGVSPDDAAAFLGYDSGDQMLSDIVNAPKLNDVAKGQAEAEMKQQHGDILNDGTINKLADEATHNEQRGQLILQEMKVLARGTNRPAIDRAIIKQLARENIGKLTLQNIRADKYRRAEIKAAVEAQQAMDAGDKAAALAAKTRQAMNFYLWREAVAAHEQATKITKFTGKFRKASIRKLLAKAGNGYLDQIDGVLTRFEFRTSVSVRAVQAQRDDISKWAAERAEEGDNIQLTAEVLTENFRKHYREIPFEVLTGVHESLVNLDYVARFANKVNLNEERLSFEELKAKWLDHLANLPDRFSATRADVVENTATKSVRSAMSQMTKIPFLASWLDGGKRAGMSHDIMIQPITEAAQAEQKLWGQVGETIMEAIKGRSKADIKRHNKKLYIPEIDAAKKNGRVKRMLGEPASYHLHGHQVLAVALNTGNESNLRKMILGEGWATPEEEISIDNPYLQAVLRHMTKSDWELVQTIWNQIDTLYAPMAVVHKESSGLDLPKIEATKVQTPFGEFDGGYYPVKYDPERSKQADDNQTKADEQVNSMFADGGFIRPAVNTGAKVERTEYFAPIRFDLGVVPNHVQEVIHYITHFEAVRKIYKITNNTEIANAITSKLGRHEYRQIKPWLNDIAKDGREAPTKTYIDSILRRLRFGTTLGMMGFKVSTGLIQISGLSNTFAEVGTRHTARAIRHVLGSPATMQKTWDFAVENSQVMSHRSNTLDRELKSALGQISGKSGIKAAIQETSMKHIALIQTYMVDLPTWYAAYYKGIEEATASLDPENFDSAQDMMDAIDKHAFKVADFTVENIQGSGMTKDLPALMRNQAEGTRMMTMFMTFFSALWNIERDLAKGARSKQYSPTTIAAKAMFLFAIPVAFEMFMRGDLDDDDEQTAWEKYLTNLALFPAQSVPFIRDALSAAGTDFDFQLSPLGKIMESGIKGGKGLIAGTLTDEDVSSSQLKGATKLIGAWYGIPGVSQVWATGEHIDQVLNEGEDLTLHQLAFGPERE